MWPVERSMNATFPSWKLDSTAWTPSGAIPISVTANPTGNVLTTDELATSITEIDDESRFATYTLVPDGLATAAVGVVPTITEPTVTATGSNMATVLPPAPPPKFAAYTFDPS